MPDASGPPVSGQVAAAQPVLPLGPGAPPSPTDPYRPLSHMALIGFALAVLYTVLVVGGGIISFSMHIPWLLSFWAVLLPLTTFSICLIARQQIRNAEGTLSGESLATTGLLLSIVVGLTYGAYYVATRLAVVKQATDFVENDWFDRLRKGEFDKAFVKTLAPPRPDENDPDVRDQLETLHNSAETMSYSMFPYGAAVQAIAQGGQDTVIDFQGTREWGFMAGGYQVGLIYKVTTPNVSGLVGVTVRTHEGGTRDVPGRKWYVVTDATHELPEGRFEMTPLGQKRIALANLGHTFAQNWIDKLKVYPIGAFLETLPVNQRFQHNQGAAYLRILNAGGAIAGLGFRAAEPEAARAFHEQLQAFREGALMTADPPAFWCLEKHRAALIGEMKNAFRREGDQPTTIQLMQQLTPTWKQDGDVMHFRYELDMKSSNYKSEGVMTLATKVLEEGDPSRPAWRVEKLELTRGRSTRQDQSKRPGQPPGMMGGTGHRPPTPSPRR